MGVAGQIFAARVAIGLAVPSPRALADTGGMLAGGIKKIYTALNQQRVQAAKQRVSESEAELNTARQAFETHSAGLANNVLKNTKQGMAALVQEGGQLESQFARQGADAFKSLKGSLQAEDRSALFKGISEDMDSMQRLMKLTENFTNMTKTQQREVIKQAQALVKVKERNVKAAEEEAKRKQDGLNLLYAEGKISDDTYNKTTANIQRKLDVANDEYAQAVDQKEIIDQLGGVYDRKLNKELEENARLSDKVTDKQKKHDKASEDLLRTQKDINREAQKYATKIVGSVNKGVQNYTNTLRETVSVLTAFYYKLNQSTQQLIEFERELLNANSVFNVTRDDLFMTGEVITQFGQRFGMEMQNGATGLYQLASAGLDADEALQVLPETLKLSMAVQGDHNTISKLTTQVIAGFGMEMSDSALLTDKFAHAIQKSLIEYEDLSSAVKFALPFFTATGQSIDQLLGALQILTNRALEAGIAGRGLRQALAEFAENADNNEAAFRQMGIEIRTTTGEMKQLTEIAAEFAEVVGEDTVNNTELLSTLIDDLNVRGATAFIHLVQASDEFTEAVNNTANAGGELDEMVRIQNESMQAQIQILKNNVLAMFFMRDAAYEGTEFMNGFHEAVMNIITSLSDLIVVEEANGYALTAFGQQIQDIAIDGLNTFGEFLKNLIETVKDFSATQLGAIEMLKIYLIPLQILLSIAQFLGPELTKMAITFYVISNSTMLAAIAQGAYNIAQMIGTKATYAGVMATLTLGLSYKATTITKYAYLAAVWLGIGAQKAMTIGLYAMRIALIAASFGLLAIVAAVISFVFWLKDSQEQTFIFKEVLGNSLELLKAMGRAILAIATLGMSEKLMGIGWFKFGLFLNNTMEMLLDLPNAYVIMIDGIVDGMKRLLQATLDFASNIFSQIMEGAANIGKNIKDGIVDSISGMVPKISFRAQGGFMGNYAAGGVAMVGERGPELVKMPQGAQVLNNTHSNSIMRRGFDDHSLAGAVGGGSSMKTMKNVKITGATLALDTFKGGMA